MKNGSNASLCQANCIESIFYTSTQGIPVPCLRDTGTENFDRDCESGSASHPQGLWQAVH